MTDLGNKVMESMFDAWCDDRCKEITPDHNDYSHNLDDVVQQMCIRDRSYTLKPKLSYTEKADKVTYKSSNKKIATVSKKGVIKGKKKGTATITIKSGKITKKCKVKVK